MSILQIGPDSKEPDEPSDSLDLPRNEQLWTARLDECLNDWLREILTAAKKHNKISKMCKLKYRILGIPSAIIPLIIGIANAHVDESEAMSIFVTIGLCVSAIFSTINTFLNLGSLMEKHLQSQYQYEKLGHEIQYILHQKKASREQSDVTMTRIRLSYDAIAKEAPDI